MTELDAVKTQHNSEFVEEYLLKNKIGRGSYGVVYEGLRRKDNEKVAIKRIFIACEEQKLDVLQEISIQRRLNGCKNIMPIYDAIFIEENESYNLILGLYEHTLERKIIGNENTFNKHDFLKIAGQLVNALAHMQRNLIKHCDLKPENILMNNNMDLVVTDFGIATDFNSKLVKIVEQDTMTQSGKGTPIWMAPELIMGLALNEIKDEKLLKVTIDSKKRIFLTRAFASDVYSLGLIFLAISNPRAFTSGSMRYNMSEKKTKDLVSECLENLGDLSEMVSKMVDFDPKNRPDFLEIEDFFLYSFNCPFKYFTPLNIKENDFDSLGGSMLAFEKFTSSDFEFMNSCCFKESLYFVIKVPDEFIDLVLSKCTADEKKFSNNINSIKKEFNIPLENKKIANINEKFIGKFEELVLMYTFESDFYKVLNKSLANNDYGRFSEYLKAFIICASETENYACESDLVYRVCAIHKGKNSEDSRKIRLSYFPGVCYYWPSFTSTSKNLKTVQRFARNQFNFKEDDMILFRIRLNKKNKKNKFEVKYLNPYNEEEILIFPYFRFTVVGTKPDSINLLQDTGCKNSGKEYPIMLIDIEEMDETSLPVQLLWFDPNISNKENSGYQKVFTNYFKLSPCYFEKSIEECFEIISTKTKVKFLVISCGSQGQDFIEKIKHLENVYKICIFCLDKLKHSKWFTKEKYPKFLGIFDQFKEIQEILPKYAY